jgi:S-adenosylmethionine:tRNA ribosyltransferase-isomerase
LNLLSLSSYDYQLPEHLIAQTPATPAESARCLLWDGKQYHDKTVSDLPYLLDPDTLLIFNDTKVVKARIPLLNAQRTKVNGSIEQISKGEIFFLKQLGQQSCEAMINPGKKFQVGDIITQDNRTAKVLSCTETGRILEFSHDINDVLEQYGQTPLPPYISYNEQYINRYQSVMAKENGSVAAPTASLHFTPGLISQLKHQGHRIETLTLHVGLGTFKTVQSEDITHHDIHDEQIFIPHELWNTLAHQKLSWNPVLAIGTTVTRTLESMPYIYKKIQNTPTTDNRQLTTKIFWDNLTQSVSLEEAEKYIHNLERQDLCISCSTKIFLYPGKSFHVIDQLLTNFHLPKSSLLMLVAAYMGYENMMACYHHAIKDQYRFFSFGDCMLLKQ